MTLALQKATPFPQPVMEPLSFKEISGTIERRIQNAVYTVYQIPTLDEYETHLFQALNALQFEDIPGLTPCGTKLYMTRGKIRKYIWNHIHSLSQFFSQKSYEVWEPRGGMTYDTLQTMMEKAVKLLARKQQGKH